MALIFSAGLLFTSNLLVITFVCLQDKGAAATPGKRNTKQETSKSSPPESKISPGTKRPSAGGKNKGDSGGKKAKRAEKKEEQVEKTPGGQRPKNSKRRTIASKVSYKEESNSDEEQQSDDDFEAMSWEEDSTDSESKAKSAKKKGERRSKQDARGAGKRRSSGGKNRVKEEDQEREEDEEFEEEGGGTRKGNRTKQRNSKKKEGPGADEWLEVYLDKTSSWLCVDVEHGVGLPHLCSQNTTAPMTYVVSVDGDGFVKDLGRKYDPTWMTSSRKRRVDEEWWEETLEPFLGPEDERDRKEDKEVRQLVLLLLISNSVHEGL